MKDYLVASETDSAAKNAIIMLPDIWGQTDYSFLTLKQLTQMFSCPCYMLDYFYVLTKVPSKFNPKTDEAMVFGLMDTLRGEEFMEIFLTTVEDIKAAQPKLETLTVIGFCFGGRLAYLTGLADDVDKIVSFYGAGAHTKNYYQSQTPVEALCNKRQGDTQLSVLSFYGDQDGTISAEDQTATKAAFQQANINYQTVNYEVGHAYFQPGRPNYNQQASKESWLVLEKFITGK